MPRNRRPQDREQKREEIVAAARQLFVEEGYDATSMSRIATAVGVTTNTIYWYFDDKDDVLIAVLNAVVADALAAYDTIATQALVDRLMWLVERLQESRRLVTAVHARVALSPALDAWHTRFHESTEQLFREALQRTGTPVVDLDAEIRIGVFVVEGLLTHELDAAQSEAICRALAAHWPPDASTVAGVAGA